LPGFFFKPRGGKKKGGPGRKRNCGKKNTGKGGDVFEQKEEKKNPAPNGRKTKDPKKRQEVIGEATSNPLKSEGRRNKRPDQLETRKG